MAGRLLDDFDSDRDRDAGRKTSDLRHRLILAAFALGLVAWRVIDRASSGPSPLSWSAIAADALATVALFVLAAGLLRLVDLFVLYIDIRQRAKRSQRLSSEIRNHLSERA
jgi:hypothetical protein